MKFTFLTLFCLSSLSAFAQILIPNFNQVTPDLYRGGRPTSTELKKLITIYNVKTIIDVENIPYTVNAEELQAKKLGLQFYNFPMSASAEVNPTQINQLLKLLQDESLFPIYVHCKHGQDRTGMVLGLYRVLIQKWTPQKAYKEMLDIGFHPQYEYLVQFFKERTGYKDPRKSFSTKSNNGGFQNSRI